MTPKKPVRRARLRFLIMLIVGATTAVIVLLTGHPVQAPAAGWAAAAASYVGWVLSRTIRLNAAQTREHATSEDPSRGVTEALILSANIAAIVAVAILVISSHQGDSSERLSNAALGFVTVALSWMLIQTLFTLRYAEMYYGGDKVGGIAFNQDEPPQYTDFAYLGTSLGMTYQVSDTNLETTAIRKEALKHSLLSYLFGTVVLASTINLVVSLAS
ncbi:putative membrane protein [Arthrobacter woluwensis]|uniref:DUF1345 domain-containing protein n=1 Tax=Arthrobacter woluwensis TaxID=156980 RepID=UPI00278A7FA8|nr:DUF1345 domain-containing protein [Arthrobacter woluwensis]MDQ0710349.1 putative membrane protein [Arthrobacter woluwensis]